MMSDKTKSLVLLGITAFIFLFYFFNFEGYGLDYWDTYIAAPATFAAGKPCVFTNEQGAPAYKYSLENKLPHDLVGQESYGIVSKDQRIGAGITFAPAYLVFGSLGFRLFYAVFGALGFLLSYMVGLKLFDKQWKAIALGVIVMLNPFMIMMNRLNANFITVTIMMGLAALLLEDKPKWIIAGLVYGALGGIRNEAIMLVPALCLFMLSTKSGRKGIFAFGFGAVAGIAPYLAWNKFAFGKALIHASQFSDFEGHRPMFPHEILGWKFEFNGLFNWPFHDQLVRTPHYPLPTWFTLPLVLILCFGVILTALALIGLWAQWKKDKRIFGLFSLWVVFSLGLFLFQENWEEPKTTFGALNIPALGVFMVAGLGWMIEQPKNWKRWLVAICIILFIEAGILGASRLYVPVDERWYVRFPKAKTEAAAIGCINDLQRREWFLFHTDECPKELEEQRSKLTKGNLFPNLYYPLTLNAAGIWDDWGRYEPKIFDIWDKIYGY